MTEIECDGCSTTVDEKSITSIAEFYGISSAANEVRFCEECIETIDTEPNVPFVL